MARTWITERGQPPQPLSLEESPPPLTQVRRGRCFHVDHVGNLDVRGQAAGGCRPA
jgi:hypothetical protein